MLFRSLNKFTAAGRNAKENEAFQYISKLANFRKSSTALTTGHTMQYVVREGVYVYFRYDNRQTVMVVTNTGQQIFKPDWSVYQERVSGYKSARDVLTLEQKPLADWTFSPGQSKILELIR